MINNHSIYAEGLAQTHAGLMVAASVSMSTYEPCLVILWAMISCCPWLIWFLQFSILSSVVLQALSNVWLWVSVSVPASYWKDDDWPRVKSMRIGECPWESFHWHFLTSHMVSPISSELPLHGVSYTYSYFLPLIHLPLPPSQLHSKQWTWNFLAHHARPAFCLEATYLSSQILRQGLH